MLGVAGYLTMSLAGWGHSIPNSPFLKPGAQDAANSLVSVSSLNEIEIETQSQHGSRGEWDVNNFDWRFQNSAL